MNTFFFKQSIITTASDDNSQIFEVKQIDSLEEVELLINEYEINVENQQRKLLSLDGMSEAECDVLKYGR